MHVTGTWQVVATGALEEKRERRPKRGASEVWSAPATTSPRVAAARPLVGVTVPADAPTHHTVIPSTIRPRRPAGGIANYFDSTSQRPNVGKPCRPLRFPADPTGQRCTGSLINSRVRGSPQHHARHEHGCAGATPNAVRFFGCKIASGWVAIVTPVDGGVVGWSRGR